MALCIFHAEAEFVSSHISSKCLLIAKLVAAAAATCRVRDRPSLA